MIFCWQFFLLSPLPSCPLAPTLLLQVHSESAIRAAAWVRAASQSSSVFDRQTKEECFAQCSPTAWNYGRIFVHYCQKTKYLLFCNILVLWRRISHLETLTCSILSHDQIEHTNYPCNSRSPGGQWVQNLTWVCCLLGGIFKLPWQCFGFFWLPIPIHWYLYLINIFVLGAHLFLST